MKSDREQAEHRLGLYSVPTGSLFGGPEAEARGYLLRLEELPKKVRVVLGDMKTGAFTRGLVKSYGLPEERSAPVAFDIMRIAMGTRSLASLPSLLSTNLRLPSDKAQKMAEEIERDLLAPIMPALQQYWTGQKKTNQQQAKGGRSRPSPEAMAGQAGAKNVLNLKDTNKPPAPPPMP